VRYDIYIYIYVIRRQRVKQTEGVLQIYCKIERENSARKEIWVMLKEKVTYRLE
jgi:hypothetical protein